MTVMTKDYISNCLIEAVKAKVKDPKHVKILVCWPWENETFCPHFMWTDGEYEYDFGNEDDNMSMLAAWTLHEGCIRRRRAGFLKRYKSLKGKVEYYI